MKLTDTGESRLNGYLFILQRTLASSLPRDVVDDAVKEIASHLRDRVALSAAEPDERTALEKILMELGPPLRVAQAYAAERTLDEAVTTSRFIPTMRAIAHLATTTTVGFVFAVLLAVGYSMAIGGVILAVGKIVFPDYTGFWYQGGGAGVFGRWPTNLSVDFSPPPGQDPAGGYWIVLIGVLMAVGFFVVTNRASRRFLTWCRGRRPAFATD